MTGQSYADFPFCCLHYLPFAAVRNDHELGGSKQQNAFSHRPGRQKVNVVFTGLKSSCRQGPCSFVRLSGKLLASSSYWWLLTLLCLWLPHSDLCLRLHVASSSSVCIIFPLCFLLIRTVMIGFKVP